MAKKYIIAQRDKGNLFFKEITSNEVGVIWTLKREDAATFDSIEQVQEKIAIISRDENPEKYEVFSFDVIGASKILILQCKIFVFFKLL